MPRRPAAITQADVARAIRAVQAAGLPVLRVVVRPDGVAVETTERPRDVTDALYEPLAEDRPPVIL
ncbi:hypothetical protein ASF53_14085 [Methylobacterium sp. Leaf123]|uniref:hypothetical protein n=1 Tax=Methylobacterium sp. Leaf123 TaxID=1736264 RepID=UPI0007023289|nr:hypothetical protein [Methylobacterium sp. Leaf123]KQQ13297.1 hypothetical protein ASF53_14085 [Methylobacterium sp. Leaf123]